MSKPTVDIDYEEYRADTIIIKQAYWDIYDNPINLGSFNLKFSVRDEFENEDEVIQKDRTGGVVGGIYLSTDAEAVDYNITETNQLVILIDSDDTKDLRIDIYPFDIEFSKNGKVYTSIDGNLILKQDKTRNV